MSFQLARGSAVLLCSRRYASSVFAAALPRGTISLMPRTSEEAVDWLSTEYTQLSLAEMSAFHKLCGEKMLPPGVSFDENLLQALGSGGGGGVGVSVAAAQVSAAGGAAPGDAAAAAAAAEGAGAEKPKEKKVVEKMAFDVKLASYPAENKVKLIKELRTVVNVSIQDAKKAIDGSPGIIAPNVGKADAEKLKGLMEKHGAKIELL